MQIIMMTIVHDVYMCRLDLKVGEHTICAIKPHSLLVLIVAQSSLSEGYQKHKPGVQS